MRKLWLLTKVLIKNNLNLSLKTKAGRRNVLLYVVMFVCMSPMAIMLGYSAYTGFAMGAAEPILYYYLLLQCLFNLLMVGITFPPVFYFSDDNELLMTLPVSPFDIVGAKTLVVLSSQIFTMVLTAIPLIAAYCLSAAFNVLGLLFLVLSEIFVTLTLFAVMGTIWILVFAFLPKVVNKDRFTLISGIIGMAFAIGISVGSQMLSGSDSTAGALAGEGGQMTMLVTTLDSSIGFMKYIFFQLPLAAGAVANLSVSDFLLEAAVFIASIVLYAWAAKKWYLKSASAAAGTSSKKKTLKKAQIAASPAWKSYLANDVRVMLRTPAYSFNIVFAAFIIPLMFILMIGIQIKTIRPVIEENLVVNGVFTLPGFPTWAIALAAGLFVTAFVAGSSSGSATAISRMGLRGVEWMKTIPMPISQQVMLKMVPSIFLSIIGSQLCVIVLHMLAPYPVWYDLLYFAGNIAASILANEMGLLADLIHPKLIWDSETNAVKNNTNSLILLGIEVVLMILLGLCYIILPFAWATLVVLAGMIVLCFVFYFIIRKKALYYLMKDR